MNLLLDYDGVLHPSEVYRNPRTGRLFLDEALVRENHSLFEHALLLEHLLDESGVDVKIVLSTSWVRVLRNFSRTKRYLPDGLQQRVIGATWHTRMSKTMGAMDSDPMALPFTSMTRCQQIVDHCERNQIADTEWVAIDDDDAGWAEHLLDNLVHTDEVLGLGKPETQQELLRKLRGGK